MAKKFLVNLDLAKNQILNAAIQNLSSAPSSPVNGQIYYNTSDNRIYFWDSTTWIDMSGDIRSVLGGSGLTGNESNGVVTLDLNVDNSTVEVVSDTLRIKDGGITTAKIADLSTNISSNSGTTAIPTADAVKQYVDSVAGGLGNLEGGWDAWTTGKLPAIDDSSANTKKGDYWYSTASGVLNTPGGQLRFEVGDVFIAKANGASQYSIDDWIILQVNRDQATEDNLGFVRIADQSTVNAGTDDTEAVTPLKLKTYLDNAVGGYAQNLGDNSSTSFFVTHNLNTYDIITTIYSNFSPREEVITDVEITGPNDMFVRFAVAPAYNEFRVVIKK